ncbi:MAG: heparinase II/III domain-containing protein, partial [Tepidisphaeraceae bacterium]
AGPRGGNHGHFDLLNFELFGFGKPLIADPGPLRYDNSSDRKYVVSTFAHNTVSADGVNVGSLEGNDPPGIGVDQWTVTPTSVQVTAHHFGYAFLTGGPVVARSLWYDRQGTILVVDWAEGVESHTWSTSFNIPGSSFTANLPLGTIRSTNASGGNVQIQSLLTAGQTATNLTKFTSSQPPPNEKNTAQHYSVSQTGSFVCFATLISAYNGAAPPSTSAILTTSPAPGATVQIQLNKSGVLQNVVFTPPGLVRLNSRAASRGGDSDLVYDSRGYLHEVFYDRDDRDLKYTVRSPNGKWSILQTIDNGSAVGFNPSIAVDSKDRLGIAYTDSVNA